MQEQMILDQSVRQNVIQEIKGSENNIRMEQSQEEWDIYSGNIEPYVIRSLKERFDTGFLNQLPLCSSVNILKKMVDQKGSIYKQTPERTFSNLSEMQREKIDLIYRDARANFQLQESDKLFELQKQQTHVIVEPKGGKITMKPLKSHQVNVVPSLHDPEVAEIYILSAYNKLDNTLRVSTSDGTNQSIADQDDVLRMTERYIWWSKNYHFVTDGNGNIITEKEELLEDDLKNPIGMLPVIEISQMKDFTYWRQITNDIAQFTVDINDDLTMLQHIIELQGFSQAYLKAPADLMPKTIQVGPSKIIKLVTDPNNPSEVEFGYATPSSDINGSMDFFERKIAMFLSSQGVSPSAVSGKTEAAKFTSGTDRLLANIEKMEASRDTMSLYSDAEAKIYQVIKAWYNTLIGTNIINKKYFAGTIAEDSELEVKFPEPSIIMSEVDKLDYAERMKEVGVFDDADVYAYVLGVSREAAIEEMKKKAINLEDTNEETEKEMEIVEDGENTDRA